MVLLEVIVLILKLACAVFMASYVLLLISSVLLEYIFLPALAPELYLMASRREHPFSLRILHSMPAGLSNSLRNAWQLLAHRTPRHALFISCALKEISCQQEFNVTRNYESQKVYFPMNMPQSSPALLAVFLFREAVVINRYWNGVSYNTSWARFLGALYGAVVGFKLGLMETEKRMVLRQLMMMAENCIVELFAAFWSYFTLLFCWFKSQANFALKLYMQWLKKVMAFMKMVLNKNRFFFIFRRKEEKEARS